MALKLQSVKSYQGKADSLLSDFWNALVKLERGDYEATTTITYNANNLPSTITVQGDIEFTISFTYDSSNRPTQSILTIYEYIYKEHLIPNYNYSVYNARFDNWDVNHAATVYKNGDIIDSGFVINYDTGEITFDPALTSSDDIQCSYVHTILVKETYSYQSGQTIITRTLI